MSIELVSVRSFIHCTLSSWCRGAEEMPTDMFLLACTGSAGVPQKLRTGHASSKLELSSSLEKLRTPSIWQSKHSTGHKPWRLQACLRAFSQPALLPLALCPTKALPYSGALLAILPVQLLPFWLLPFQILSYQEAGRPLGMHPPQVFL